MSISSAQNLLGDATYSKDASMINSSETSISVVNGSSNPINQTPLLSQWQATTDPDVIRELNTPANISKEMMQAWEAIMTLRSRASSTYQQQNTAYTNNATSLDKQDNAVNPNQIPIDEIHSTDQRKEEFFTTARAHHKGKGVDIDYREAVYWYKKAAKLGHAGAHYNLGYLYKHGWGVKKNVIKAVDFYKKAAKLGNADAQYNMGLLRASGKVITRDLVKAVKWYKKAAEQDYTFAQHNYAVHLSRGEGINQDQAEAYAWYEKAANRNFEKSQKVLVRRFFQGIGITKDLKKATYWFMRLGLSTNGDAISLPINKYFGLVPFILEALSTFPEFKNVTTLHFSEFSVQVNGQIGAVFADLIKNNHTLTTLEAPTYPIDDTEALMIMQALDSNTTLRNIELRYDQLTAPSKLLKNVKAMAPKRLGPIFGLDMRSQFLAVRNQNRDIFELREYLKNYLQTMEEHPKKSFDELPSEVMQVLTDQIIVINIKKGFSEVKTKALLDEFLLSAMKVAITLRRQPVFSDEDLLKQNEAFPEYLIDDIFGLH